MKTHSWLQRFLLLLGCTLALTGVLSARAADISQTIGTLQPGESVTITYEVTIDNPLSPSIASISAQGQVSGSNFTTQNTDDPETLNVNDATVTALDNEAPFVDLNGASAGEDVTTSFTEQTPALIAPDGTVTDADGNPILSLTVTLGARPDGDGVESLSLNASAQSAATGASLTVLYTPGTGVLSISGSAAASVYQTVLQGLLYNNTSDTPTATDRTITVVANDTNDGLTRTATITATPVNDPPSGGDNTVTTAEDTNKTFALSDFPFTDPDGPAFGGIQIVTVETAGDLEEGGVDVAVDDIIEDVTQLVFIPVPNANGNPYATFTFKARDSAGALSAATYTMTINVSEADDDPTGGNNTVLTGEGWDYTFAPADFPFSDLDGDTFDGIQIVTVETAGDLEESGTDVAVDDIIENLSTLVFKPVPNAFGTAHATFTFKVRDTSGAFSTATYTMTIDVFPIGDLPTVTPATTQEGQQTTSGLVLTPNAVDGAEITHFLIANIQNGTLFQNDGTTPIVGGAYITVAQGGAGLKFTPTAGLYSPGTTFGFDAGAATSATGDGLGPSATAAITVNPNFDFGDAPDPTFPTLLASDGARHVVLSTGATIYLGAVPPDIETDSQPSANADGDNTTGTDDEDGVAFPAALPANSSPVLTVTANDEGFLSAWIDWNRDGDWADTGEKIFEDVPVSSGANPLTVSPPAILSSGATLARFRLVSSDTGGTLSVTGEATDGEVEDYLVTLNAAPVLVTDTITRPELEDIKVKVFTLLANDSDPESDGLSITSVGSPTPAGASVSLNGDWVYYVRNGVTTAGSFTYTVEDARGAISTGTVNVDIADPDARTRVILDIVVDGGGAHLTFDAIFGRTYHIQYRDDVLDPWQEGGQAVHAGLGRFTFTDAAGHDMRYYRAVYRD